MLLLGIFAAGVGPSISSIHAASPPGTVVARHGARTEPVVALTIDDGFDPANCRKIVEILERRQVPATFFPAAKWIPLDPGLWQWIAALGFPIGNHTDDHGNLTHLTLARQTAEIALGKRLIETAIGEPLIPVLRPPGGAWNADTVLAAARNDERLVLLWDTTFADTSTDPVVEHYLTRATSGQNGSVILLHCGPAITPTILETVIDAYLKRGMRFVTIPELFGFTGPTPSFGPDAPSAPPNPSGGAAAIEPSLDIATPTAAPSVSPTPALASPSFAPSGTASAGPPISDKPARAATPDPGASAKAGLAILAIAVVVLLALGTWRVARNRRRI